MKKTYQNPTIKVVKVQTNNQILADSSLGIGDPVNSASKADSRGGSFWEDEDY